MICRPWAWFARRLSEHVQESHPCLGKEWTVENTHGYLCLAWMYDAMRATETHCWRWGDGINITELFCWAGSDQSSHKLNEWPSSRPLRVIREANAASSGCSTHTLYTYMQSNCLSTRICTAQNAGSCEMGQCDMRGMTYLPNTVQEHWCKHGSWSVFCRLEIHIHAEICPQVVKQNER